jgi:hypothetical protein
MNVIEDDDVLDEEDVEEQEDEGRGIVVYVV